MQFITLPIFILTCLLSIRSTAWAYAFLSSFYVIEMTLQASVATFLYNQFLANYIFAGVVVLTALNHILRSQPGILQTTLNSVPGMILLMLLWSIISVNWSPGAAKGREFIIEGIPYILIYVVVAPILIDSTQMLRRALVMFLGLGTVTALLILINPEFKVRGGRLTFQFGTADVINVLQLGRLGGSLLITAAVMRVNSAALQPIRLVAFIVGSLLAFYSGSRGQIVAAGLVSFLFFPVARPLKNIRSFFALAGVLVVGYVAIAWIADYVAGEADINRWDAKYILGASNARILNIIDLFRAFGSSPQALFVGLGFNAFTGVTTATLDTYAHNIFVEVLCELGVFFFAWLLMLLFIVLRAGYSLFRSVRDVPELRAPVATLLAITSFDLLIAQKEGQLWNHFDMYFHFCLIARLNLLVTSGLAPVHEYQEEAPQEPEAEVA
ncbi:MAG: hypothetical protein ACOYMI_00090 [Phycisphaerales bacterium]